MKALEENTGSGRYLISCLNPDKLNEFISSGYQDPTLQLIDTVGPVGLPHTAVYEMSHSKAAHPIAHQAQHRELLRAAKRAN